MVKQFVFRGGELVMTDELLGQTTEISKKQ